MSEENKISVFLVDDDALFLLSLSNYLNKHLKSLIKIHTYESGEDCLRDIKRNVVADVVILDYCLSTEESSKSMNGIGILKLIKKHNSDIIVVMLSSKDKLPIAQACIGYGAYEYVVKSETALIRIQNILKNLINEVSLQSYYPYDFGGEA